MLLHRPVGAARATVLAAVLVLVTLLLTVGGAVLPTPTASAASTAPKGSVSVRFVDAGVWGGSLRSTYALTNRAVSVQFYLHKAWSTSAGRTASVTAVVERRSKGVWRATGQRVATGSLTFHAALPAYSTRSSASDATVAYRLRVPVRGVVGSGATSPTITVHYRNPLRFSTTAWRLYTAVHRYCGSAVIRIVHLSGDAAGDYTTGQYALRIDSTVADYARIDQRAVALHECGHYLQWRNYGATNAGWERMTRDARAVFGTNSSDPVEHMADCISQAANPGGYLGYGGSCTKAQKTAAKRMLAGLADQRARYPSIIRSDAASCVAVHRPP